MADTENDAALHTLSPRQSLAVAVLASGGSHEEAARAARVHRITVTRWANHHPAVVAELNRLSADAMSRCEVMRARITNRALEVVEGAIERGDVNVAMRWLQVSMRQGVPAVTGPTDPYDVVEQCRKSLPSTLDRTISEGQECSTAEAIAQIHSRLLRDL